MKRPSEICAVAGGCVFALVLAASSAAAAESGQNPAEAPIGQIFRWLNFAVVLFALGYLILKYAPSFFRGRATAISAEMSRAAAAKAEAEQVLRDAEEQLAHLDEEVARLRAAAQREARAEAEHLHNVTASDIEKIVRAARVEIEAAEREGRLGLKAIAAGAAIDRAEALIRQQLTPESEAALFHNFVAGLAGSAN